MASGPENLQEDLCEMLKQYYYKPDILPDAKALKAVYQH